MIYYNFLKSECLGFNFVECLDVLLYKNYVKWKKKEWKELLLSIEFGFYSEDHWTDFLYLFWDE